MAAPKASSLKVQLLGGSAAKDVTLEAAVFGAELKKHVVHEVVRAELNAHRAGTRGAKTRGLVAGGRSKPWRQKGTGRARQGTIRAPHFTGGGVAFAPGMRSFELKVNRKVRRAALAGALSNHVGNETLALVDGAAFETPSTKQALALVESWGKESPLVVVAHEDEEALIKSFRNLERVLVTVPSELEVAPIVWARSVLVSEAALPLVEGKAIVNSADVLIAPVVSEKSYAGLADRQYTFKVHQDAHKTQVRQAVEQLFGVKVKAVRIVKVAAKPKRRGVHKGVRPGWKKAVVQLHEGQTIEIFEGAQV